MGTDMTSMDCADIRALLSGLVDDEVDMDRRHRVERHLASCSACRQRLDDAERTDRELHAIVDAMTDESLPRGFEEAVIVTATGAPMRFNEARRHWSLIPWVAITASAAALALSFVVWQRTAFDQAEPTSITQRSESVDGPEAATIDEPDEVKSMVVPVRRDLDARAARTERTETRISSMHRLELPSAPQPVSTTSHTNVLVRTVTPDDDVSDALHAASQALRVIADASEGSFADVQHARRVVAYDELLPRLDDAMVHVTPEERFALIVVTDIFQDLMHGPMDMSDVRGLKQRASGPALRSALEAMVRRYDRATML